MQKRFLHPLISFVLLLVGYSASAQTLVSAQKLGSLTQGTLSTIGSGFGLGQAQNGVDYYRVLYRTPDPAGVIDTASAMVVVPVTTTCDSFALMAYCHGTVLRKDDVPGSDNGESLIGKLFGGIGYVVAMPDYIGLGSSKGIHPYMHAESEATATIDAMRAARELIADSLQVNHNNQVFITGYSQGGHAAMATHKYIQDNSLQAEFEVASSAPCSGPYNMSGSQSAILLSGQPYSNPGYVVYLLASYQRVYGNIYNTWEDILKLPYALQVDAYLDGTSDMNPLNAILPGTLDSLLQDSVLQNFQNTSVSKQHPLWQALIDNDNFDWTPQEPIRMYYCTNDEQVGFQNSLDADSAMHANGAVNVQAIGRGPFDHGGCVQPALSAAQMFFDSTLIPCTEVEDTTSTGTGVTEIRSRADVAVYPNPTQGSVRIDSDQVKEIHIYDAQGRLLEMRYYPRVNELELGYYPKGIYFLHLFTVDNQKQIKKILLQ